MTTVVIVAIVVVLLLLVGGAYWMMPRSFLLQWDQDKTLFLTYDVSTKSIGMGKVGSRFNVDTEGHLLTADRAYMFSTGTGDNGGPVTMLPLKDVKAVGNKSPMPTLTLSQHELKYDEKTELITDVPSTTWDVNNINSPRRIVGQKSGDNYRAYMKNGPVAPERKWKKI